MDASSAEHTSIRDQKRPRFQLCFSVSNALTTKSDIYKATVKLCGIPTSIITPKFYSLNNSEFTEEDEEEIQTLMKKLAKITDLGPREKYEEPLLESHSHLIQHGRNNVNKMLKCLRFIDRYGWFQEKFIEKNPEIDKVDFPKKTSEMVKIQNLFAESKAKMGDRCQ